MCGGESRCEDWRVGGLDRWGLRRRWGLTGGLVGLLLGYVQGGMWFQYLPNVLQKTEMATKTS